MPSYPGYGRRSAVRNRLLAGLIAAVFAAGASPVSGGTYIVDNTTKLDALSAQLPTTGVHYVRFEGDGYPIPGSLTLTNNGCDSLVFERKASSDTGAVRIQGTLMRLQGQRGTVVLRGLAFKFETGGTLFDLSLGDNQNLILDGCTFLGNGAGPDKVLAWNGRGKVSLKNCMFTNLGATRITTANDISIVQSLFVATGPIELTQTSGSGRVALFNNLFNFPEVLTIGVGGQLEMWFNTTNRTQLHLDGRTTGAFSIHNNYFANPPVRNKVAEAGESRFAVAVKPGSYQEAKSVVVENVRYPAWDGFTNPLATPLFGATNETTPAVRDSAVPWDWRIPGNTKQGAWNGNIPLPVFDLFPPDTSMNLPIPGGRATVLPAPFPRIARFSLKAVPQFYSGRLPDSVRSWFQKDTLLALDGKVAVLHLTLPNREDGTPILVVPTNDGFRAGPPGPRGGTQYRNFQLKAQEFIPALGGQNTFTGSTLVSTDPLRPGIFMTFSSVTRAGMTTIGTTQLRYANRKWRVPQHQGQVVAFSASTTAEVGGPFRVGVPVAGTTVFRKDSLFLWRGGEVFLPVKDSGGKFIASVPPPFGKMDAILVERMTFGPGADTLNLPKVRVFAKSAAGHQMVAEPVQAPDDPSLGAFGVALKFSWPGRLPGDTLSAQFPRTDSLQQVWIRKGNESLPLPLLPGDPGTLRVALGIGDSNQIVFVARQFKIPVGRPVNLAFGRDSVLGLIARRPGEMFIDAGFRPADLDTTRLIILAARGIRMDSLVPQGPYTLSLDAKAGKTKDLVRALVHVNGIWEAAALKESDGRYAITVPPFARAAMVVEFPSVADWAPAQPAAAAAMSIRGDSLVFVPGLTPAERSALPLFRADLLSLGPDGNLRVESSRYASVEASLSVGLAPDRLYAYRVVYRSPLDRLSPDLGWTPLSSKQPSLAAIEKRLPVRQAGFRHLVGFPFDGATVGANVLAGTEGGSGAILALDTLVSGQWAGLPLTSKARLERGKGYLLAASRHFRPKAKGAVFSGLKPDTLRFGQTGWHLIANPLPFPFPRSALGIPDSSALSFPRGLRRLDTTAGSPAVYDWPVPDTLQPFEGYLLYVFKPTYLAFDPYFAASRYGIDGASGAPAPAVAAAKMGAPKLSASGSAPEVLRMTLTGPGGSQSAVFYRSGPYLQTPYMRLYSETERVLEFRAGEGGGWAYRKVDRLDSLRIPIEVVAPEAGTYTLGLSGGHRVGEESSRPVALLDLGSGKVYHGAEVGALALAAGRHAFVLLHGKAAAPGVAAFSAGLPDEFALDQNAPNPFRGRTRIRFRVPGGQEGPFRGRFRVTSMDGRTLEARDLGALSVGEHALTVDENGWRPGVYVYELRLESGRGTRVFRRRMVCGLTGG